MAVALSSLIVPVPVRTVEAAANYMPLDNPARVLDTRPGEVTADHLFEGIGKRAAGSTLELTVADRVGVPGGAASVALNVTVTEPGAPGFVTVFPCGQAVPKASNLNYAAGQTIPNFVIAKVGVGGKVCLFTRASAHLVVDVVGVFPAGAFTPLGNPARVLDTRPGEVTADHLFEGIGKRAAGSTLELTVADRVGVPGGAASVALNVTVTEPGAPGFVTVFPCGQAVPKASNLNYAAGQTIPNFVIAKVGVGGKVCLFTRASAHLVVDVVGVFPAGAFTPLGNPARVLDTRPGEVTADHLFEGIGKRVGGVATLIPLAGRVGIPAGASAVVLNVTVTRPDGPGFASVFPSGVVRPNASNLNYGSGATIPNLVIAKLGGGGTACLFTLATAHYVVDVAGFLAGPAPSPSPTECPAPPVPGLRDLPTAPSPRVLFCDLPADLAHDDGVVIHPGLAIYLDDFDTYVNDIPSALRVAYTIMVNSGPLPTVVANHPDFVRILDTMLRFSPGSPDRSTVLSFMNLAYHETLHALDSWGCVPTGIDTGARFDPNLGPLQSASLADVDNRIDAIAAGAGSSNGLLEFYVDDAHDLAGLYLSGNSGNQTVQSPMTEMVAYVQSARWGAAIGAVGGGDVSLEAANWSTMLTKWHQLYRYLELARQSPAHWAALRDSTLPDVIAQYWQLTVSMYPGAIFGDRAVDRFQWDLAFGPDVGSLVAFTDGAAGTGPPPRP